MTLNKNNILSFLKENKLFIENNFGVKQISLFGSYTREEATDESDIDIFVEMAPDFFKRCQLINFIEEHLNKNVNVIRKHSNLRKRFLEDVEKEKINVI